MTEYLAFFEGTYSAQHKVAQGGGVKEEGEDIEVIHLPLNDALQMIETGRIQDAKTIILLQRLALKRLQNRAE